MNMIPLIFPYTNPNNSVLKKIEDKIDKFSIISLYTELNSIRLWQDIYHEISAPDKELLNRVFKIDRYYMIKFENNFSIDLVSDFFREDGVETTSAILKELNGNGGSVLKNDDENGVLSSFFLLLSDRYEDEKDQLNGAVYQIEKKENEIFENLLGRDSGIKKIDVKLGSEIHLPQSLVDRRVLAWIDLYLTTKSSSGLWITDNSAYIDFFKENLESIEKEPDSLPGLSGLDHEVYSFLRSDLNGLTGNKLSLDQAEGKIFLGLVKKN